MTSLVFTGETQGEGVWLAEPEHWVTSALNLWTSWGALTIRGGGGWLRGYRGGWDDDGHKMKEKESQGFFCKGEVRCKKTKEHVNWGKKWGSGRNEGGAGGVMMRGARAAWGREGFRYLVRESMWAGAGVDVTEGNRAGPLYPALLRLRLETQTQTVLSRLTLQKYIDI